MIHENSCVCVYFSRIIKIKGKPVKIKVITGMFTKPVLNGSTKHDTMKDNFEILNFHIIGCTYFTV